MVWLATLLAHLLVLFLSSANPIRTILVALAYSAR